MADLNSPPISGNRSFLADGGEIGAAMRARDWSSTPLGPVEHWPEALRVLVGVMLGSDQPMFVAWGAERIMLYNDGYAVLCGKRHPAALGQRFEEVWYDILDDVLPILDRAYAGEGTHMDDIAFVMHRNGYPEEAHFSFSYTPVRALDGRVDGMFCACQEITEQVLTERRRVSEMERLRQLFERAPGFMAILEGPEHRITLTNGRYFDLIGKRDVVGQTVAEAMPEAVEQGFVTLLDRVYATGEPFAAQGMAYHSTAPDGGASPDRIVDFVYQPMRDAEGEISGIFVSGYDVTDRHRAERRLRESEERFRAIADSAPVPVWVSKPDRTRSFVNTAYLDFVGLDYDAAAALDWRTILHGDDHDRIVAESIAGEASLKPFSLEARYRGGDGAWHWLRSTSQPRWAPDGAADGFIGVAHDITAAKEAEIALRELNESLERRVEERTAELSATLHRLRCEVADRERVEEALRQSQKMEAVGQLTGGIAHDFNNLLTPVIGGLEIINGRIEDPRLKRLGDGALESARRGAKLATQLLAFSRLQRIVMVPVDVNGVIEEMEHILLPAIGPGIEIATRLDPQAGHGLCDANQLENAILNLAINARDAMPDGGRLSIATSFRSEPGDADLAPGDYVQIAVEDEGHGMTPAVLSRAVEPFFSTKPIGKGTGLGLAQVYGIARQSGGTVRIDSREGEGTAAHILLPSVAPAGDPATKPAPASTAQAAAATIVIVDDDTEVRAFLAEALDELGHRVTAFDTPAAFLAALDEIEADLVLVDFAMPGMNGAELAEAVRHRRPGQRIAFVTGYCETDQLVATGNAAVLRKPFSLAELSALVARETHPG